MDHYRMFGGIVHHFAEMEWLIQATIAGVSEIPFGKILVLTKALSYRSKRDTLYSYLEHSGLPASQKADLKSFLDGTDKYNVLRNNIAHAMWKRGSKPKSIKPVNLIVRGGKGRLIGMAEDEQEYTLTDLGNINATLQAIYNSYLHFLRTEGLMPSIAKKISETTARASAPDSDRDK
jgi:hypothetical protein